MHAPARFVPQPRIPRKTPKSVPVLALSQMTRPHDRNLTRRPCKFDLKESGSLEADAHTVLLIFQPVGDTSLPQGDQAEIIIAKQRNGPLSIEPVQFDEPYLLFRERAVVRSVDSPSGREYVGRSQHEKSTG